MIPREDQLTSIFSLTSLNHLEITIRRPNTDGLDDLEEEVLKRLNGQNLEEEKILLKAQPGLSIQADDQTKGLAHVAQLNGEVRGSGFDFDGKRVEKSTKEHPLTEVGEYVPGEITSGDFLLIMADRIVSRIGSIKRPDNEHKK